MLRRHYLLVLVLGSNAHNTNIVANPGLVTKIEGYWSLPRYVQGYETAWIRYMKGDTHLTQGDIENFCGLDIQSDGGTERWMRGNEFIAERDLMSSDDGFIKTSSTNAQNNNVWHRFELTVDRRDPNITFYFYQTWYQATNNKPRYFWYKFTTAGSRSADKFYFSEYSANPANWRVYKTT